MKVAKSLLHKIINQTEIFHATLDIYNDALAYVIEVIDKEFDNTESLTTKSIVPAVEKLIHATKSNPLPKYKEFNERFYKFPSYFRRSAIASAFGKIKSFRSNYQNWEKEQKYTLSEGKNFKKQPPRLQVKHKEFPVFYRGNMFSRTSDTSAQIKVFHQNDWVWIDIEFKGQDHYKRGVWEWKENNPKLIKRGKKFFLSISYENKVTLSKTPTQEQKVCAVDLGLTNSAVCSIIDAKGTILGRTFIDQPKEKDRLQTLTNKLRKAQRASGRIHAPNFWRQINGHQQHIVRHTSHEIVKFASKHGCDVIVFEYLGRIKTPKGFYGARKLRFKLHGWRKIGIQNKVEEMAHCLGMRISRINPRNTSALAFDGSGKVERNPKKDLAVFSTGKVYHADLSASYNIGSRYFIRAFQKSISETKWLSLQAKVPELAIRTSQTLSSFISLHHALGLPEEA
ncbi:RNA-guided endonuclease TnpB family protein [Domibacillus robiginosus]|uniref:RNA-guided endonuclease TnpB family protein n=1 Tax=Domibacillus robiginosus TaxID=1071054 RepID=UPI00067C1E20|nr:RNA-guided endonuclease TnpB family protein [Domibacillus robiginosus]